MKKILALIFTALLAVTACLGLTACGTEKIGFQAGTTGEYFVAGDEDWGFDGLKKFEGAGYSNPGLAISDLKNGQVKYVITDKAPALELAKSIQGIKVIDIDLTEEEYAYGVDKSQVELKNQINKFFEDNKQDVAAIFTKYAEGKDIAGIESAKFDADKADKQLVIATNAAFPPFEYKDGNKFAGIDIEICKLIADKLGLEFVVMDMEFEAVVTSVGKNGVDLAAAALTVNEKRKESVDFTNSYYNAAQVLITLSDDTTFDACKTADDVLAILNK